MNKKEKDQYNLIRINPELSAGVNCLVNSDFLLSQKTLDTGVYIDLCVDCF